MMGGRTPSSASAVSAGELETINILYVTDPTRHLLGVLSVRDLLLAE